MVVVVIGQGGVLGGETEGQVHIRQASVALVLYRRQVETLAGTRPEGCQPVLVQVQDRLGVWTAGPASGSCLMGE